MSTPSHNPPTTQAQFRRRLGYYLVGLAIGCFMAGGLYYARRAQWQREEEARRQAELQFQAEQNRPAEAPAPR